MKHQRIGLDIDEVLADWVGAWCKKYNIPDLPTQWVFDPLIGERFASLHETGKMHDFYMSLPVKTRPEDIPFTPHCYITSRPCTTGTTRAWLDANGFPDRPVYTVPVGTSKVEAALYHNCDAFVDDHVKNFNELTAAGITCYLFDARHNQECNAGDKRIYSLKELI